MFNNNVLSLENENGIKATQISAFIIAKAPLWRLFSERAHSLLVLTKQRNKSVFYENSAMLYDKQPGTSCNLMVHGNGRRKCVRAKIYFETP